MYLDKKATLDFIGTQMFSAVSLKKLKKGQAEQEKRTMLAKLVVDEKFFAGGSLNGDRSLLLEVIDINILKKVDDPKKAWRSITLNLDENLAQEKGLLLKLNIRGQDIIPLIKADLGKGESNAKAA